jgi:hypothetical protein
MSYKETYLQAYQAGFDAFALDAADPTAHTNQGEGNRWIDWRDDFLLVLQLSPTEMKRRCVAFHEGYLDASELEPG